MEKLKPHPDYALQKILKCPYSVYKKIKKPFSIDFCGAWNKIRLKWEKKG